MIDRTETLKKVAVHLKTQGKPARSGDTGMCMYRGPEGTACAIGHLLPDDAYTPSCEKKLVSGLPFKARSALGLGFENKECFDDETFLSKLQLAHDDWGVQKESSGKTFWEFARGRLLLVAQNYQLDPSVIPD